MIEQTRGHPSPACHVLPIVCQGAPIQELLVALAGGGGACEKRPLLTQFFDQAITCMRSFCSSSVPKRSPKENTAKALVSSLLGAEARCFCLCTIETNAKPSHTFSQETLGNQLIKQHIHQTRLAFHHSGWEPCWVDKSVNRSVQGKFQGQGVVG